MRKIFFLLSILFISSQAQARTWPETFSRQQYHRYYIENRLVTSMPRSLPEMNIEVGKPAYLSFITAYILPRSKGQDIPQYLPALRCITKNVPLYDQWTFMIALNKSSLKDCNK